MTVQKLHEITGKLLGRPSQNTDSAWINATDRLPMPEEDLNGWTMVIVREGCCLELMHASDLRSLCAAMPGIVKNMIWCKIPDLPNNKTCHGPEAKP